MALRPAFVLLLAMLAPGGDQAPAGAVKTAQPGPIVSMEWLNAHLNDPGLAILDADGDKASYRRAHIPKAGLLGHMETLRDGHRAAPPDILAGLFSAAGARDDARIILYGRDAMSVGWMFGLFASLGHADHVSVLDGNLDAWRAASYPIATGDPVAASGRLSVKRPATPIVVDGPWVREHMQDPSIKLADVRAPDEWKRGMIPGAAKLRWEDFYASVQQGRFKTPEQIRQVFESAGLGGGTVVTYCAVGMRASLAYFAARVAGLPVLLYQGSMNDWEARPGYPQKR